MKIIRWFLSLCIVVMLVNVHLEAMEQDCDGKFPFTCSDSDKVIQVPIKIMKHSSFFKPYIEQGSLGCDPFKIPANKSTFEVVVQCLRIIDVQVDVEKNLLDYIGGFIVSNGEEEKCQLRTMGHALQIKWVCDIFNVYETKIDDFKKQIIEQNIQKMNDIIREAYAFFEKVEDKQNSAIVIDVDDTALCCKKGSHTMEVDGESTGITYYPASIQVRHLYKKMIENGFKIFFLTARNESDAYVVTIFNLKNEGYDIFEELICAPNETRLNAWEQANGNLSMEITLLAQWKERERNKIAEKFKIVGTLDDTEENLKGENIGYAFLIPKIL